MKKDKKTMEVDNNNKRPASSKEQLQLFELISDFAVVTVLGWIANAYKSFTRDMVRSSVLKIVILRFANEYFEHCARWIYNREDDFINTKFDTMMAKANDIQEIDEAGNKKYDPIDILKISVSLSMQVLAAMEIGDVVSDDYEQTMTSIRAHLISLANSHKHISVNFRGCDCGITHLPPNENERIFNIELKKAVISADGEVDISDNWFDDV